MAIPAGGKTLITLALAASDHGTQDRITSTAMTQTEHSAAVVSPEATHRVAPFAGLPLPVFSGGFRRSPRHPGSAKPTAGRSVCRRRPPAATAHGSVGARSPGTGRRPRRSSAASPVRCFLRPAWGWLATNSLRPRRPGERTRGSCPERSRAGAARQGLALAACPIERPRRNEDVISDEAG